MLSQLKYYLAGFLIFISLSISLIGSIMDFMRKDRMGPFSIGHIWYIAIYIFLIAILVLQIR